MRQLRVNGVFHRSANGCERRAFTLVEMLVVIAIIAILAGILLGVLPGVMDKRTRKRVEVELNALVTAIEYYKEKQGFYPPDNPENIAEPPLLYELAGSEIIERGGTVFYRPLVATNEISSSALNDDLDVTGIINSSADASEVKSFYPSLRPSQYGPSPYNSHALVLLVPVKGPMNTFFPNTRDTNTWRYIVAKPDAKAGARYPTNNPNAYDLWAEIELGGKTVVIGNWRK